MGIETNAKMSPQVSCWHRNRRILIACGTSLIVMLGMYFTFFQNPHWFAKLRGVDPRTLRMHGDLMTPEEAEQETSKGYFERSYFRPYDHEGNYDPQSPEKWRVRNLEYQKPQIKVGGKMVPNPNHTYKTQKLYFEDYNQYASEYGHAPAITLEQQKAVLASERLEVDEYNATTAKYYTYGSSAAIGLVTVPFAYFFDWVINPEDGYFSAWWNGEPDEDKNSDIGDEGKPQAISTDAEVTNPAPEREVSGSSTAGTRGESSPKSDDTNIQRFWMGVFFVGLSIVVLAAVFFMYFRAAKSKAVPANHDGEDVV